MDAEQVTFHGYRLERTARRLFAPDGTQIHLTARVFDVLDALVAASGRTLGRDELLARVWQGRVVEENNLNQAIAALRRAFGTHADDHEYILTIPGRGYRFVAPVLELAPAAAADPVPDSGPAPDPDPDPPSMAARPVPRPSRPRVPFLLTAALLLVGALGLSARDPSRASRPPASIRATHGATPVVAIPPFRMIGAGQPDLLLAMGMADTLIARLGGATDLKVLSLPATMPLAERGASPLQLARKLGADYVVDGSTQVAGGRVRVNARLVALADGRTLWADSFDADAGRVFAAQDELARAMSAALALHYPRASVVYTSACDGADPEAYRAYLHGTYLRARPGEVGALDKAVAAYDQAIARDPGCARAWAGKAIAYRAMAIAGDADPAVAFPRARAAVERALRLDPRSADAYASKGIIEFFYDHDWPRAEASLRRAVALEPGDEEAQYALAHLLHNTGRLEEALPHARRAIEADPLSPILSAIAASFYADAGHRAEADRLLRQVLDLAPEFWLALYWRGNLASRDGDWPAAIRDMRRAVAACGRCSHALAGLAWVEGKAGHRREAQQLLQEMQRQAASRYYPPTRLALAYDALGERGRALEMLERAYAQGDFYVTFLLVDPRLRAMQDEPRYRALLDRMKLAPAGTAVASR